MGSLMVVSTVHLPVSCEKKLQTCCLANAKPIMNPNDFKECLQVRKTPFKQCFSVTVLKDTNVPWGHIRCAMKKDDILLNWSKKMIKFCCRVTALKWLGAYFSCSLPPTSPDLPFVITNGTPPVYLFFVNRLKKKKVACPDVGSASRSDSNANIRLKGVI